MEKRNWQKPSADDLVIQIRAREELPNEPWWEVPETGKFYNIINIWHFHVFVLITFSKFKHLSAGIKIKALRKFADCKTLLIIKAFSMSPRI